jgi:succinate-semialdehyde dehydrogenase/glutarate-semialdehyde dehydrogenase
MTLSPADALKGAPTSLFIAGHWAAADSGATLQVEDPATGETIAAVADAGPDEAIRAMDAAAKVQTSWGPARGARS